MSDFDRPPGQEAAEGSAARGIPAAPPVAPMPAPRKSRTAPFLFGTAAGCLVGVFVAALLTAAVSAMRGGTPGVHLGDRVAVLPLEGEITDARDFVESLHKYADNSSVRAIVVRINSPGGGVAPSQEMYEEIRKVRKSSAKPIVASVDSVAASGGFYVAAACDQIVANPGSITGSIGVIMQWMDVKDLLAWARLKPETITSGAMKDSGSPFREMTDAERAYFQKITEQLHRQFVKAVVDGRSGRIGAADLARLADGRVFTGEEALSLHLIDRLGNLDDAVHLAAGLAKMHGEPDVLYPHKHRSGMLELLSGDAANAIFEHLAARRTVPFLYKW